MPSTRCVTVHVGSGLGKIYLYRKNTFCCWCDKWNTYFDKWDFRIESQWEAFEKKLEAQKSSFAAEALQLEEKHKIEMNIAMARLRGIKQAVDGMSWVYRPVCP